MKKKIALGMATIMATGCFQVTAFGANFSDINDVPWDGAKNYINQVADQKLMVGDVHPVTGKMRFRAKEKVTYCEVTQLAYSILQNTGKLKASSVDLVSKWTHVLKSYNIPTWAYPAVSYALENNITTLTEVSGFMNKKGSQITGKNANREEVATIFGRALAPYYTINENPSLIFTDKAAISKSAAPYVDLLSRLNILVGDSEKNFTPKVPINRAEMAVLVLKTSDIVKGGTTTTPETPTETSVTGTVASVEQYGGNKLLAINLANGTRQGFMINESTYVLLKQTTTQMNISDLAVGDGVYVEYSGSSVKLIRILSDKDATAKEVSGTVDDLTSSKIYVKKSDSKVEGFTLADKYTLTLDGKSTTLKLLTEAYQDATLKVTLTLDSSGLIKGIKATKEEATGITGILVAINDDELSYKTSSGSKTLDYSWTSDAEVYLEGKKSSVSSVRSALKSDDLYVKFFLDSKDRVKKAMVSETKFGTSSSSKDFYGTATTLSDDRIRVKKSSDKETDTYYFASSVSYYLDGESSSYRKVNAAYEDANTFYVRVILDTSGKVKTLYGSKTESKVTEEKYDTSKDGILYRIDSDEVRLDGKNYPMSRNVNYYLEGKSSKLSAIEDALDYANGRSRDFYVTIYLDSDDEVVKVEASASRTSSGRSQEGEISSLSKSSIKIKGESSVDLASSPTITLDEEKISVSDLIDLVDDSDIKIEATITIKSDEVTKIEAFTQEAEGNLISYDRGGKTIKIKTRDKNSVTYAVERTSVTCTGDYESAYKLEAAFEGGDDFEVTLTFTDGVVTKIYNKKQ